MSRPVPIVLASLVLACAASPEPGPDAGVQGPDAGVAADGGAGDAGEAGDAGTAAGPLALGEFEAAWTTAFCDGFVRCGEGSEAYCRTWVSRGGGDVERFDSYLRAAAAALAGQATYDPAKARACVESVGARPCGEWRPFDACIAAFTGKIGKGESCASLYACERGLVCRAGDGDACSATCETPFDSCIDDRDCGPGDECGVGSRTCGSRRAPGGEGEACGSADRCAPGLGCFEESGAWKCRAFGAEGTACDRNKLCGEGLRCSGTADFYFRCVRPIAEGDSCAALREGCATGLACLAESATVATCRRPKDVGEACTRSTECGVGPSDTRELHCDRSTGKCARLPASGACANAHCDPLVAYCDLLAADPTCAAYKAVGASCLLEDECGPPDSAWFCGDRNVCERGLAQCG